MLLAVAMLATACASAPEDPLLRQYFRASQLRDIGTLGRIALVSLDPTKDGAVTDFSITTVSPERTELLKGKDLSRYLALRPKMPNLTAVDAELISKDVTINATLKLPDNSTAQKPLVVTLQRVKAGETPEMWIVSGVRPAY